MTMSIGTQLLKALEKIDRPGTFCASGRLPSVIPGLKVSGVGTIALPLEKRQAAAIRKVARQAPYGKGTQTLVDTNVRRVWEIDADQVTLSNPEWTTVLKQAIETVQAALGLENQKLEAHLYKLLLYEMGSFFLPHRDGEKIDRMVATLVIALPSSHEGGQLVVRHEGQEQVVDFSAQSGFQTQFAAFYADCEHEIRPVTGGFRLALVYNLTLDKAKRPILAPTSREHVAAVAELLGKWRSQCQMAPVSDEDEDLPKLAVLLEHEYTKAGLTIDALKGVDRARADVLFAAAHEAGCDASLALVTYWESGAAEPSADDYGYGRRRRYYDDEGGDDDDGGHTMAEVFDQSLTAKHFSDADGNHLAFGEIPLADEEIVSDHPLQDGDPDEEDFEGFTGNAGMTLERWYHRAGIVLWPGESRFDILCEAGVNAAVGGLEQMVRRWKQAKPGEQAELKSSCLQFAGRIIAHWPQRIYASASHANDGFTIDDDDEDLDGEFDAEEDEFDEDNDDLDEQEVKGDSAVADARPQDDVSGQPARRPLLSLLEEMGDVSLILAWIRGVLARDASIDPGKTLGDVCQQHGWAMFQAELLELFDNTSNETLERHARLLADFSLRKDRDADRKSLCAQLAGRMMAAVDRWDPKEAARNWQARVVQPAQLLPPLTQALLVLDEPRLLERLVTRVLDHPKDFDLTTVQVPALLDLQAWLKHNVKEASPPLDRWLTSVVKELETRKAHPPREPSDWRRESQTGCTCADCKELARFLNDPGAATLRLPLAEHRRQHLHQVIDGKKLDTTHATERKGRPYTLILSKTKASYERALKAHQLDLDHLAKMQVVMEWHNGLKAAA